MRFCEYFQENILLKQKISKINNILRNKVKYWFLMKNIVIGVFFYLIFLTARFHKQKAKLLYLEQYFSLNNMLYFSLLWFFPSFLSFVLVLTKIQFDKYLFNAQQFFFKDTTIYISKLIFILTNLFLPSFWSLYFNIQD